MLTLKVHSGTGRQGELWQLAADRPTLIGREAADVVLDEQGVSRRHAKVLLDDRDWTIEDVGSTNGTRVNRRRIDAPTTLKLGDEVQLGRVCLVVQRLGRQEDGTDDPGVPTESSQPQLVLSVLRNGAGPKQLFAVCPHQPWIIGRQTTHLRLNDWSVSRRHAEVCFADGQWLINDLKSKHETFVNDRAIDGPCALQTGDRLSIGRVVLMVHELSVGASEPCADASTIQTPNASSASSSEAPAPEAIIDTWQAPMPQPAVHLASPVATPMAAAPIACNFEPLTRDPNPTTAAVDSLPQEPMYVEALPLESESAAVTWHPSTLCAVAAQNEWPPHDSATCTDVMADATCARTVSTFDTEQSLASADAVRDVDEADTPSALVDPQFNDIDIVIRHLGVVFTGDHTGDSSRRRQSWPGRLRRRIRRRYGILARLFTF